MIDERILKAWEDHPNRVVVDEAPDFMTKATQALEALRVTLPECCRRHTLPAGARQEQSAP